jgi:hypothetical protein
MNKQLALKSHAQLYQTIRPFLSLNAPYGSMFIDGKVVDNPLEQKTITKIHKLHDKGFSIRGTIDKLTRQKMLNRNNKPFSIASIQRILNRKDN